MHLWPVRTANCRYSCRSSRTEPSSQQGKQEKPPTCQKATSKFCLVLRGEKNSQRCGAGHDPTALNNSTSISLCALPSSASNAYEVWSASAMSLSRLDFGISKKIKIKKKNGPRSFRCSVLNQRSSKPLHSNFDLQAHLEWCTHIAGRRQTSSGSFLLRAYQQRHWLYPDRTLVAKKDQLLPVSCTLFNSDRNTSAPSLPLSEEYNSTVLYSCTVAPQQLDFLSARVGVDLSLKFSKVCCCWLLVS